MSDIQDQNPTARPDDDELSVEELDDQALDEVAGGTTNNGCNIGCNSCHSNADLPADSSST